LERTDSQGREPTELGLDIDNPIVVTNTLSGTNSTSSNSTIQLTPEQVQEAVARYLKRHPELTKDNEEPNAALKKEELRETNENRDQNSHNSSRRKMYT